VAIIEHKNNFDFIRVLAASLVIFSHQYGLSGLSEPEVFPGFSYGGIGVLIFFSLSGYLVSQSWDRDPHLIRFATKRVLRIFPGLICVTLLMALVLGPIVTTLPRADYFGSGKIFGYVIKTIGLYSPDRLPGVFETHPIPTINSSLWTIPVEIKWYQFVAFLGLFGVLRTRFVLPAMIIVLMICRFIVPFPQSHHVLLEFGIFFLSGMAMYVCRKDIEHHASVLGPVLAGAAAVFWLLRLEYLAIALILPFIVITFGSMRTPGFSRFGEYGDLSYGLYIYAFPVQQFVIWLHLTNKHALLVNSCVSVCMIVVLAWLSCHLIEQPAMKLKGRFSVPSRRRVRQGSGTS